MMRRRRAAAFTLTELMTVVAIIGIIAALAAMSLRRTRSQDDADAWANTIRNTANLLRRRATATGLPYQLELGPTTLAWCQLPTASCAAGASISCASVQGCSGTGNNCEKSTTAITAGSDAVTDSWYRGADILFNYASTTNTYSAPARQTLLTTKPLYFGPIGSVDDTCKNVLQSPPVPSNVPGFTIYVRAVNKTATTTSEQQKHRRIVIYGVTGRPRIVDNW